jgi:hypothetical protein
MSPAEFDEQVRRCTEKNKGNSLGPRNQREIAKGCENLCREKKRNKGDLKDAIK